MGRRKKISISNAVESVSRYYSNNVSASGNHWKLTWTKGTTHGASSGSPLFDQSHKIIGQLHGGDANCDGPFNANRIGQSTSGNGLPDWYGKFSTSWAEGNFQTYLDPNASGLTSLSTYCPAGNTPINVVEVPISGGSVYNPYPTTNYRTQGFLINGSNEQLTTVCPNKITISGPEDLYLHITSTTKEAWRCSNIKNRETAHWCGDKDPSAIISKCICVFLSIFISIIECDSNLNTIGSEYCGWMPVYRAYLSEINLLEHLPDGASISPNKYYRIKLAGGYGMFSEWRESAKYIYVGDENIVIENRSIKSNISVPKKLTIKNSTVYEDIELKAGKEIEIQGDTYLRKGYFSDDQNITDCNY